MKVTRAAETLLAALVRPAGRVFETPELEQGPLTQTIKLGIIIDILTLGHFCKPLSEDLTLPHSWTEFYD